MDHVRRNREETRAEAIRLANEFLKSQPNASRYRFVSATSVDDVSGRKIPAVWTVMFSYHLPDATVDGGEMFVRANVQDQTAERWDMFSA